MSQTKPWPLSVARTTGTENYSLLQALLASTFDEISTTPVSSVMLNHKEGRINQERRSSGLYSGFTTGFHGPFHETEDHQIKQHGLLLQVTVKPGLSVGEVVKKARESLRDGVIVLC